MAAFDYVRQHYGVPACHGRRVIAYGKPGVITTDFGHYVGIVLDEDVKRRPRRYHPEDGIVYGEMATALPKPPRYTNFDRYKDEEWDCEFHEFLNINLPDFETRGRWPKYEYRMYRRDRTGYSYRDVEGEWAPTKKAAKASYKAALKMLREPAA